MTADAVARGLADTFDVAIYLTGVAALLGFAGGVVAFRAHRKWWRIPPARRPLTYDCPPLTDTRTPVRDPIPFRFVED